METISIFDFPVSMPLAARVRPETLDQLVGQETIKDPSGPISSYLNDLDVLPSLILYGPPGTGKTSTARIIAKLSNRKLKEISAINSSIAELREAFQDSVQSIQAGSRAHLVFIDEIHRFSRVQQESVLKAVEQGEIVLIGATTENPKFSLVPALISRCFLIELSPLTNADLEQVITSASKIEQGLNDRFSIAQPVTEAIATLSGGDARKALSILETAAVTAQSEQRTSIELRDVSRNMSVALARYDASGDQHYDVISAFIKSIRGSDPEAALHYLARMIVGGEDPRFIERRLAILAAEDVGLADPSAINIANSVMQIVGQIGMPEGRIPLAELTIYLALAPKSNSAYLAINRAIADVEGGFAPQIPIYLRSNPPQQGEQQYLYPHDDARKVVGQAYLAEKPNTYYEPQQIGTESELAKRLSRINELRAKLGL
ncbi:MAG: replication-associated recombination protein A [Rhodoluna sp.]